MLRENPAGAIRQPLPPPWSSRRTTLGEMMRERRETAYHEAGHVVADYVQQFVLGDASIVPDPIEGRHGYASGEAAWSEGSRDVEAIISMLAGLAAARLVFPGRGVEEGGAGDDYEKVNELLPSVSTDLETLEARAAELVVTHRPLVDAVAELLLEEEYVVDDDLELVCVAVEEGENWRDALATLRRRSPLAPERLQALNTLGITSVRGQPLSAP
jgi:ATP-dependent Zn protease